MPYSVLFSVDNQGMVSIASHEINHEKRDKLINGKTTIFQVKGDEKHGLDKTIINGLNLWIVSDNLLRGAALNSVEIADTLIKNNFYGK